MLINTELLRAVALLAVPAAWWADALSIWLLYAVALIHGLLTVFFDVAYVSYLPILAGRDYLVEGNAKLASVRSAVSVGGPGLAGPLVAWLGAPLTLAASSAGMALSALAVMRIRKRELTPVPPSAPRLRREVAEGLRFVLGHRLLRPVLVTDGLFSLFLIMYQSMLLVYLARELGLGSFAVGMVLSVMACGGLAGAVIARAVVARIGVGPAIWLAPLCTAPLAALVPLARPGWSLYLGVFGLMALSLGGAVRLVTQAGLQQSVTPDHLLGRMSATFRFVTWGSMPLAGLLGGVAGSLFGAPAVLWVGAAGMAVTFLPVALSPLRRLRELPDPVPAPEAPSAPQAGPGRGRPRVAPRPPAVIAQDVVGSSLVRQGSSLPKETRHSFS